jgi:small redox-active disulfide protein 2
MKIQIFGTGCEKCTKLYEAVQKVVQQHGLEATVEKVSSIDEITAAGVMMTPALAVDGKIVVSGKVLATDDILHLLAPEHASHCGCHGHVEGQPVNRVKQVITLLLLALVGGSLALMVMREMKRPQTTENATLAQKGTIVYYFYGNHRCATCNKMQELTRKAVEGKDVVFKAVNLDEPQNEHFVKDFQLDARVVVIQRNGSYKKMGQVWDLVHGDEKAFIAYIQSGLQDK